MCTAIMLELWGFLTRTPIRLHSLGYLDVTMRIQIHRGVLTCKPSVILRPLGFLRVYTNHAAIHWDFLACIPVTLNLTRVSWGVHQSRWIYWGLLTRTPITLLGYIDVHCEFSINRGVLFYKPTILHSLEFLDVYTNNAGFTGVSWRAHQSC